MAASSKDIAEKHAKLGNLKQKLKNVRSRLQIAYGAVSAPER